MIEEIKELKDEIIELKDENIELKDKVQELEDRIEKCNVCDICQNKEATRLLCEWCYEDIFNY